MTAVVTTTKITQTSASARRISTNVWVQLNLRATPCPPSRFQRQLFRRSLHSSIYSTQCIENDVSAKLPNISPASCDLLTSEVDRSCPCLGGRLMPVCTEIRYIIYIGPDIWSRAKNTDTADVISDKTHRPTSVAFVDNSNH